MTDETAVNLATVLAAVARAQIECAAMQAENQLRASNGAAPAYSEENFVALIDKECIGYNSVILEMRK
jgi:hypothetical protein